MVRGTPVASALRQVSSVMNGPAPSAGSPVRPTHAGVGRVGRVTMEAPARGRVTGTS